MWAVFQIEENGLFYAWMQHVNESDNILSYLRNRNVLSCNIIRTKKRAVAIAEAWNREYKAQGRYLFSTPLF